MPKYDYTVEERAGLGRISLYQGGPQADGLLLNANENSWPLPESVAGALRETFKAPGFNRYPEIDAAGLRQVLAPGTGVDAANIRVGNGSSELLCAACYVFGGNRRKIAYIYPSFSMYKTYAALSGGVDLPFALEEDFSLDFERLRFFLRKERPAVMIICNPNNPTGNLYPAKELKRTAESAGCPVLIDEAYMEFAPEGSSLLGCLKEYKNIAVSRTFSKAYGLAGLRVGYMAAGDARIIQALGKAILPYNVNALSLALARAVYAEKELYAQIACAIVKEKERVYERLCTLGLKVYPSAANFLFFRAGGREKTAALAENAARRRVFMRDFSESPDLAGLRMTIGTYDENEKALAVIKEFLA
ncbi:MAG: histidinol-phosphate transaminase [Acidaminococcales bacterium]|jgi:histidinol-phosphate aminotransferase|nr:histidinol-phosphate transaminase [Acidaminococcales bacterium]